MSAKGRPHTPNNAAPATGASKFLSSPVKSSKNVAGHDREEVAEKVVPHTMGSYISPDLFLKLLNKSEALPGFTTKFVRTMKIVKYINELSKAVRMQDDISDSILFVLSENKTPKEHPTGTKCRPDFVAIKIAPEVKPPSSVTLPKKVVSRSQSTKKRELVWSQLEATGEIFSKGQTHKDAVNQGASYTVYLLQARPDLDSVVGIFIHPEKSEFQLYFTDAWGICCTEAIGFDSENAIPLLVAWIRHLYDPKLRPNITRAGSFPDKPTFTIVASDTEFTGCVLLSVGLPFHRRSTIFTATDSLVIKSQYVETGRRFEEGPILGRIHESRDFPGVVRLLPATGAMQSPAMVEVESDRSASSSGGSVAGGGSVVQLSDEGLEADVTEQGSTAEEDISGEEEEKEKEEASGDEDEDEEVPGEKDEDEEAPGEKDEDEDEEAPGEKDEDEDKEDSSEEEEYISSAQERETAAGVDADWPHSRRPKDIKETLLVLQDKAEPLMDAETPLEALIAFYDLLEVTRFLYKLSNIFHRDISSGNVLLRQKDWKPKKQFEGDFGDMCFASHLLGEIRPNTTANRLYTRVVLIDFHMAEDRGMESGKQATDRSGTPMFMARLVRKSEVQKGGYFMKPMPQLQDLALKRYNACVGNRISEFPKNDKSFYEIENDEKIQYSHRLSYDAESILWLLLWWAIQAQPHKGDHKNHIRDHLWGDLTGGEGDDDPRQRLVSTALKDVCHTAYQGLNELLQSLFEQLSGYHEQIARPPKEQDCSRTKDEYLHEAFQRTIFDFIVKNIKQPFMGDPISRTRRPKETGGGIAQSIRTPGAFSQGVKRKHVAVAGEETESKPPKKTKNNNQKVG